MRSPVREAASCGEAGTTRDVIEVRLDHGGLPSFSRYGGVREASGAVERRASAARWPTAGLPDSSLMMDVRASGPLRRN